jgi:hypothetical protein
MRKVTGLNGADNSAAALAWLLTQRQIERAHLYLIGEPGHPRSIWLTDYDRPLTWGPGTFGVDNVSRSGVSTKIGLDVVSLEVTWSPSNHVFTQSLATTSPYQLAQMGYYDNWPVHIWRLVMPTPGDVSTYGAYEVFGGRVAACRIDPLKIVFSVNSWTEVLQMKVPANVIDNANVLGSYTGAHPPAGFATIPTFNVIQGSTNNVLILDCINFPNTIFNTNIFQRGWLLFDFPSAAHPNETLGGIWSVVGANSNYVNGAGHHYNQVQIYTPLPFPPTPGSDTCFISAPFPIDQAEGTIGYDNYPFPYVPAPESAF